MKLNKNAPKSIDLTKEGKEEKGDTVWKRIAEQFGSEMKLMTALTKNEASVHVSYRGLARNKVIIQRIVVKNPRKFPSVSHVYRACESAMALILYHMHENPDDLIDSEFYKALHQETDEIIYAMSKLEGALSGASAVVNARNLGIISEEEATRKIERIVDVLPEATQHSAKVLIEQARAGTYPLPIKMPKHIKVEEREFD